MPKSEFDDELLVIAADRIDVAGPFEFDDVLARRREPLRILWRVEQGARVARGVLEIDTPESLVAPPEEVRRGSLESKWWDREKMRDPDQEPDLRPVPWRDGPAVASGVLAGFAGGHCVLHHWTQQVTIRLLGQPVVDP